MTRSSKPFILMVLDGWGYSKEKKWNAINNAKVPNFDFYWENCPHSLLKASGEAVGLPRGFIGGSEVGHAHLGAGRLIKQEMVKIDESIEDGSFFRSKNLIRAKKNKRIHLMGLLSDSGVHSHIRHLFALLNFFKDNEVYVHCFLDGRDTPPKSAEKYLKMLESRGATIATISGRYYSMDRDKRWIRTKKAFDCIARGKGRMMSPWRKALKYAYSHGESDEFVTPTIVNNQGIISGNDSVVFFNFRTDRTKQLSEMLLDKTKVFFVSMVKYEDNFKDNYLFSFEGEKNTLGEVISNHRLRQLRLAETEKYAHVTYFFNNERSEPFRGESRIMVPSPRIATYDLKPEMSAFKVKNLLIKNMSRYDFIVVNFANADMVGHSGNMKATIKACEAVDRCLGEVIAKMKTLGGTAIIVGDHGNAEMKRDRSGNPQTAHTTNPVPCILINNSECKLRNGSLYDVAPTILELMKIRKPREMTGGSLISK